MSEVFHPTFVIKLENGGEMKGELYPEYAPQSVGNFNSSQVPRLGISSEL